MSNKKKGAEKKEKEKLLYNPSFDNEILRELMMGAMTITVNAISKIDHYVHNVEHLPLLKIPHTGFDKVYNVTDENGNVKPMSVREMAEDSFQRIINTVNEIVNDKDFLKYIEDAELYRLTVYNSDDDCYSYDPLYDSFEELITSECKSDYDEAFRFLLIAYGMHTYDIYKTSESVLTRELWSIRDVPMYIDKVQPNHRVIEIQDDDDISDVKLMFESYFPSPASFAFRGLVALCINRSTSNPLIGLIRTEVSMAITKKERRLEQLTPLIINGHININGINKFIDKMDDFISMVVDATFMNLLVSSKQRNAIVNTPYDKWDTDTKRKFDMLNFAIHVVDTPESFESWAGSDLDPDRCNINRLATYHSYGSIVGLMQYAICVCANTRPNYIRKRAAKLMTVLLMKHTNPNHVLDVLRYCEKHQAFHIDSRLNDGESIDEMYSPFNNLRLRSEHIRSRFGFSKDRRFIISSAYTFSNINRLIGMIGFVPDDNISMHISGINNTYGSILLYEIVSVTGSSSYSTKLSMREICDLAETINFCIYTNSPIFRTIMGIVDTFTGQYKDTEPVDQVLQTRNRAMIEANAIYCMYQCTDTGLFIELLSWVSGLSVMRALNILREIECQQSRGRVINIHDLVEQYNASSLINRDNTVTIP